MNRAELLERLARLDGARIAVPDDFDEHVDADVDAVASQLLEHFRRHDDGDAFTLLFELCRDRLEQIAVRVTRQLALAFDPEDLVAGYLARLFTDVRADTGPVRSFFGLSYTALRNDALNQLRRLRRAQTRHIVFDRWLREVASPADPARQADDREQEELLQRHGAVFLSVVSVCFHRLKDRDRRALLAREVDGLSYEEISTRLGLPRSQVGMILKRARERLGSEIAAVMARQAPAEGQHR